MFEMIIFAIVFVVAQILGGFIVIELFLREEIIKRYTKKYMKIFKSFEDDEEFKDLF